MFSQYFVILKLLRAFKGQHTVLAATFDRKRQIFHRLNASNHSFLGIDEKMHQSLLLNENDVHKLNCVTGTGIVWEHVVLWDVWEHAVLWAVWEHALSWGSINPLTFTSLRISGRYLVLYQFDVSVFYPSNLMALTNPVLLKKTAYITFFIARCLFPIVEVGSTSKTHTLLS
ncbi:hypothetical protein TNCV_1546661 [Trichonephila clavipes]|nr:hypothetical protein TNCV_1546661 [Trichonephila clavipes]